MVQRCDLCAGSTGSCSSPTPISCQARAHPCHLLLSNLSKPRSLRRRTKKMSKRKSVSRCKGKAEGMLQVIS